MSIKYLPKRMLSGILSAVMAVSVAATPAGALAADTGVRTAEIDGEVYYLAGAPIETLHWAIVSVISKEVMDRLQERAGAKPVK